MFVTEDMVGHKLGEFSLTRTFKGHTMVKKEEARRPRPSKADLQVPWHRSQGRRLTRLSWLLYQNGDLHGSRRARRGC